METRQGKIEEKFLKFATNKAPYATFVIDGFKYNTFDQTIIDNHNPDDFVEMTGEMKGKFWTMQTMKKIEEGEVMTASGDTRIGKQNGKEYHLSPEEVKCRALECAIESCRLGKDADEWSLIQILKIADKFVEWIYGNKTNN